MLSLAMPLTGYWLLGSEGKYCGPRIGGYLLEQSSFPDCAPIKVGSNVLVFIWLSQQWGHDGFQILGNSQEIGFSVTASPVHRCSVVLPHTLHTALCFDLSNNTEVWQFFLPSVIYLDQLDLWTQLDHTKCILPCHLWLQFCKCYGCQTKGTGSGKKGLLLST